ncbi:Ras- protein Rab-26 [Rhizoclosmatium sp. JEL0117]|nr:Ras- protein Rab-26 [Rhizoclosmatium sp. JEL0117]
MLVDSAQQQVTHISLLVAGGPGVGKSALVSAYAAFVSGGGGGGGGGGSSVGSTTDLSARTGFVVRDSVSCAGYATWVVLAETGDSLLLPAAARDADAVLLVYDVADKASFDAISDLVEQIEEARGCVAPMLLVGNKVDTLKTRHRQVASDLGRKLAHNLGIPFREASAKAPVIVHACFATLLQQVQELYRANILPTAVAVLDEYTRDTDSNASFLPSPIIASNTSAPTSNFTKPHHSFGSMALLKQWKRPFKSQSTASSSSSSSSSSTGHHNPAIVKRTSLEQQSFPEDDERYLFTRVMQKIATNGAPQPPARKGSMRYQRDVLMGASSDQPLPTPSTLVYSPLYIPGAISANVPNEVTSACSDQTQLTSALQSGVDAATADLLYCPPLASSSVGGQNRSGTNRSETVAKLDDMLHDLQAFSDDVGQEAVTSEFSNQQHLDNLVSPRSVSTNGNDFSDVIDTGRIPYEAPRESSGTAHQDVVNEAEVKIVAVEDVRVQLLKSVLGDMDENSVVELVRRFGTGSGSGLSGSESGSTRL